MDVKVSVIIPVYNAEKYLADTLSDVVNQSLKEIEIICVDDGSTDASPEILRSFQEKDQRIRILHQKNQYCGVARNHGMTVAKGKYLIFWDADDHFLPQCLEKMYEKAEETQAQLVLCDVDEMDDQTKTIISKYHYLNVKLLPDKEPFHKYDIPQAIFNITSNHIWNKLFLREFMEEHHLRFGTGDFSEETMVTQPALFLAKRIACVREKLIYYRSFNRESSIYQTAGRKTKYYLHHYDLRKLFMQSEDYSLFEQSFLNKCLVSIIADLETNLEFEDFSATYQELKEKIFHDFELDTKEESYFQAKQSYDKMQHILSMPVEDYLLWWNWIQKRQSHLQYQRMHKNRVRRINELKRQIRALEEEKEQLTLEQEITKKNKQSFFQKIFHLGKDDLT